MGGRGGKASDSQTTTQKQPHVANLAFVQVITYLSVYCPTCECDPYVACVNSFSIYPPY